VGAWLAGDDIPSTSGSIHPVTLVKAQRLAICRLSLVVDRRVATDDLPATDRIKKIHKRLSSMPLVMYGCLRWGGRGGWSVILRTSKVPGKYASFVSPKTAQYCTLADGDWVNTHE